MSDRIANPYEQQASNLSDALRTLSPKPLLTVSQLDAFYSVRPNDVRGGDKMGRIKVRLDAVDPDRPYKVFLVGHSGSGKSTELSRLARETHGRFRYVRFDAAEDLDPVNFKPFDVLLIMMIRLTEQCARKPSDDGAGSPPSEQLLERIWKWLSETTVTETNRRSASGTVEVGVGVPTGGWWPKLLTLFGTLKGEIKLSADREEKIVNYRLSRIYELVELMNDLMRECSRLLYDQTKCQWVFVGESFDKTGVPRSQIENLFLSYANIFQDLEANLILNIPLDLVYSETGARLPPLSEAPISIKDMPVYRADHTTHTEGRQAVQAVLDRRMSPTLFDPGEQMRLIVASGGNLRHLFRLTSDAVVNAIVGEAPEGRIRKADVDAAVARYRWDFYGLLSSTSGDGLAVTWEQKLEKLMQVYDQKPQAKTRDAALNALLRVGAVQEFNGDGWFGVHPVVTDILGEQGLVAADDAGRYPGGID